MLLKSVTAAAAILCIALVLRAAFTIPLQVPRNYNEGWNAFHAADLIAGRPLYPPTGLFPNNYPPLSFIVVGGVTRLAGDALTAGRMVALAAFIAWTVLLAAAARALGASPIESVWGAAIFAAAMLTQTDYYIGVDDPEMLAHAVQGGALLLLLRRARGAPVIAGVLFAVSLFVKHTLVALPAVAIGWLLWTDRRSARETLASTMVVAVTLAALAYGSWGPAVGQIAAPRSYLPGKAAAMAVQWLPLWGVFLAVAVDRWRGSRRDPGVALAALYAGASLAAGLALLGGDGVYWNALFDAQWALCLVAALAVSRATPAGWRRSITVLACTAPLAITLATTADRHWLSPRFVFDPRWSESAAAAEDIAFLRAHPGPALCENLTLCFWAGKRPEADFFDLQQRVRRDPSRADGLVRRIDAGEFSVVLLDGDAPVRDLGQAAAAALHERYRVDHRSEWGSFLVPR